MIPTPQITPQMQKVPFSCVLYHFYIGNATRINMYHSSFPRSFFRTILYAGNQDGMFHLRQPHLNTIKKLFLQPTRSKCFSEDTRGLLTYYIVPCQNKHTPTMTFLYTASILIAFNLFQVCTGFIVCLTAMFCSNQSTLHFHKTIAMWLKC